MQIKGANLIDLGYALRYQGTFTDESDGSALLLKSIETYSEALNWIMSTSSPYALCTTVHINVGNAYMDLAYRSEADECDTYFKQALNHYRGAMDFADQGEFDPDEVARAANNLANCLKTVSATVSAEEAVPMLEESATLFRRSAKTWVDAEYPVQAIGALEGLAGALALFARTRKDLADAERNYLEALSICADALKISHRLGDEASTAELSKLQNTISAELDKLK